MRDLIFLTKNSTKILADFFLMVCVLFCFAFSFGLFSIHFFAVFFGFSTSIEDISFAAAQETTVVVEPQNSQTLAETQRLIANRPRDLRYSGERLDRGLVAVALESGGVYLSWRWNANESNSVHFQLYRNGTPLGDPLIATNAFDADGSTDDVYRIESILNEQRCDMSADVPVLRANYLEIRTSRPDDWLDNLENPPTTQRYKLGDMSTGDLDGDGVLEIVAIWEANSRDNAHNGRSAPAIFAAYKLDGTELWRIDRGLNVRSGAHYNPFLVFDFNKDGCAEVVFKTAPGSRDGLGNFVSQASRDPAIQNCNNKADYRNPTGRILDGPEFLTIFNGKDGAALDTVLYWPERGDRSQMGRIWGDDYGNRVDRFLAAVAFLDGENPSAVFARGYYTRTTLAAFRFVDGQLKRIATFDSDDLNAENSDENAKYRGRGNHALAVADVDFDGKDEIIYGASLFDDDLTGVYPCAPGFDLKHGDAHRLGDLIPTRPGLEVFSVHEGGPVGFDMRDARTGEIVWRAAFGGKDVGRGVSIDIDPRLPGAESWAAGIFVDSSGQARRAPRLPVNFSCYWDGDLGREIQDGTTIFKYDSERDRAVRIFNADDCVSLGGTKATPFLNADLFGDWREETVYALADGSGFRIYTTTIPTSYRFPTLLSDPTYRAAVAWQNGGYNQPPLPGFAIGFETSEIPVPPGSPDLDKQTLYPLDKLMSDFPTFPIHTAEKETKNINSDEK